VELDTLIIGATGYGCVNILQAGEVVKLWSQLISILINSRKIGGDVAPISTVTITAGSNIENNI
jgi:hypothetical protein